MAAVERCRFRGSLLGALIGDCLGSLFEGHENVSLEGVLTFLRDLESRRDEGLMYTDDTAMARSVVRSLLEKPTFDEKDLAERLELGEFPYCNRLKKIKEFLHKGNVSCREVVDELGHGIAALESVPTAIYSFLRCLDPVDDLPKEMNSLQRTIIFCILLGGDTDTIATMAGAVAGAYHGEEQVPEIWKKKSEGYRDAEDWGKKLWELYNSRLPS
ncbi:hypothetical protein GDO81_005974 [Engystomops pustulosus]|uniref:ADP-ribosylhydrolase ARH3 n=1 Tax=Engystomops pustulosus TaxID=76066 RepID=A0AAV7CVA4_ENGPU|nr:hypothetical protein GDO81_005974 [Engystomops pustulosus]